GSRTMAKQRVDTPLYFAGSTGLEHYLCVDGLSKSQIENLPEYNNDLVVDERYEGQVREVYQPIAQGRSTRQFMGNHYTVVERQPAPVAGDLRPIPPLGNTATLIAPQPIGDLRRMGPVMEGTHRTAAHPDIYDQETGYYGLSEEDNHGRLHSYEVRLLTQRSDS
ncbi:MAG: hypothetical protein AAFW95_12290, partial [Cyanobacteria bacterium J06638_6]